MANTEATKPKNAALFSRNLSGVTGGKPPPLPPAVEQQVQQQMGFVPNSTRQMMAVPGLIIGFGALFRAASGQKLSLWGALKMALGMWLTSGRGRLNMQHKQLASYACSIAAGCQYCQAHTSHGMHRLGLTDGQIADILKAEDSEHFSQPQRAIVALALASGAHPNGASPEHFTRLSEHFSYQEIIELVATLSVFGFLNRWNDTLATQLEDEPAAMAKLLKSTGWSGTRHRA